jgi:hypothetical protein
LFENAVLLNLLEGGSAKKKIGTWRKNAGSTVEVDFVMDAVEMGLKIPVECKATLAVKRRHAEGVVDYLRTTRQSIGVLVTASPSEVTYRDEGCCVLNIPVYLASRGNILRYARKHVG